MELWRPFGWVRGGFWHGLVLGERGGGVMKNHKLRNKNQCMELGRSGRFRVGAMTTLTI